MKVVVVGCTHAGTAAVVNICKLYPDAEVTVYERNDNVSFLSCGIALSVSGVVKEMESLFYNSPEGLAKVGAKTNMLHEVKHIDFDKKTLEVVDLSNDNTFTDSYDKLVITTGSWPITPNIEGIDLENIVLCKNYNHAKEIVAKAATSKNIVIVGAGYIGVELFESFLKMKKNVVIIDSLDRILYKYLDGEFTDVAEKEFANHGGKFGLGQNVTKFVGDNGKVSKVITDKAEFEADLVIMCVGFRPVTNLCKDGLDLLKNGAIVVDDYMQTSRKDVFAAGDCAAVKFNPIKDTQYIPLATNAVRMGTLVALNLKENKVKYLGTQGTSGIKIFDLCIGSTGLTEEVAKSMGIDSESSIITESYRPKFMPTADDITVKIVYEKASRKIIGGQIMSVVDLTPSVNTLSLAIQKEVTVEELAICDFFFQPLFNNPVNYLNSVAMKVMKA